MQSQRSRTSQQNSRADISRDRLANIASGLVNDSQMLAASNSKTSPKNSVPTANETAAEVAGPLSPPTRGLLSAERR